MTWISEDVYAKDLQPGDRFTSRWAGDHTVALSEACTVRDIFHNPLGGLRIVVEMPSGDYADRIVAAGNRVFRWTESGEDEFGETDAGNHGATHPAPRFTLTDEKDPDHPGILDAERPDMVARFSSPWTEEELAGIDYDPESAFSFSARTTGEPEVAAAVKGLGPSEERSGGLPAPFLPEALTSAILADRESTFDSFASAYAAEASEDNAFEEGAESEPESEATKVLRLGTYLVRRDELEADIAELRRDLRTVWGE